MPVAALSVPEDTGSRPVNRDLLADLRRQVARLERGGRVTEGAVGFGLPEIDDVLPGGGRQGSARAADEQPAEQPQLMASVLQLLRWTWPTLLTTLASPRGALPLPPNL